MPMWEAVCGSCGDLQKPLIEKAKTELQTKHDEAERFLSELKFEDAQTAASVISKPTDLRLQQFASWHEEFTTRLEAARDKAIIDFTEAKVAKRSCYGTSLRV